MGNHIIHIPIAIGKNDFKLRRWRCIMDIAEYKISQHIRHAIICYIGDVPCSIGVISREKALKMEDTFKTTTFSISTDDILYEWYKKNDEEGVKVKRLIKSIIINSINEGANEIVDAYCILVKKYPIKKINITTKNISTLLEKSLISTEVNNELENLINDDILENDNTYMNFLKQNIYKV